MRPDYRQQSLRAAEQRNARNRELVTRGKRIGIVGNFRSQYTAEQDWRIAWESHGWHVVPYQGDSMSARQVIGAAKYCDVLMIVTMKRWPENLAQECSRWTHTIGWRPDRYWGRPDIGTFWRDPLFGSDIVITTDGYPHDWASVGVNHHFLPQAISERWRTYQGARRAGLSADLAFVGRTHNYMEKGWVAHRMELTDWLRNMSRRELWTWRCFGGEHKFVERSHRMNNVYKSCRVTVGDSMLYYGVDDRYWSNRVPEALGRGGILIFPQVDYLAELTDGMLPMWRMGDWDGLEAQILELYHDDKRQDELRRWGRQWAKQHTYEVRVKQIEEMI